MVAPLISDKWERGDPYEQYVGRWSRRVAPQFGILWRLMTRRRAHLADRIRGRLPIQADGLISLLARAWEVRGQWRAKHAQSLNS